MGIDKNYVRVLISRTGDRILVSSKGTIKISDITTRRIHYNGKGKSIYFYPDRVKQPVAVESWGSPLFVNGKPYRGSIELHSVLNKLHVINILRMEEYLYGVLPKEISSSWPREALKTQAVAARTYAYYHIMTKKNALYDLDSTNRFQVYEGLSAEKKKTNKAVDETAGLIVVFRNKPIQAFFHSTCGGITIDDKYVWNGGNDAEYLKMVRCNYCKKSPHYQWQTDLTLYDIRHYLGRKYPGIGTITSLSFVKNQGRVGYVKIRHRNGIIKMSGNDFRLLFPVKKIRSLYFDSVKTGSGLMIRGHGWGHGVGLCQWGARGMAEKNARFTRILEFYYPGTGIIRIGQPRLAKNLRKR